jgi:predicted PurR-regulated permease PerM
MGKVFNERLKQVVFLILLLLLAGIVILELAAYIPGVLGAVTLYILSRENYFQLIYKRKWKKGWAAFLFIIYYTLLIGLPVYLAATLIMPKLNPIINNPGATLATVKNVLLTVQQKTGFNFTSEKSINSASEKVTSFLPSLFSSTANVITNVATMLFLLYYMLYSGSAMERTLCKIIPLKDENIALLAAETKNTIKSNAIGIPLIAIIQGVTAGIGYMIFGVKDALLWGFLTGVFSFLPIVGSMIVWVPLCIYLYATNHSGTATGLLLYSAIVTSQIDYIARITIMKRIGDVHPIITLFGIIVGLNLFGFIGLIFGPLLVNYVMVLFDIYMNEFVEKVADEVETIAEEEKKDNG